jgi:enoyl-CoA hydratase/carnithine racemase
MSHAELERRGDVGIITLVNPPQNRISKDLVRDLERAVHEVLASDTRALVITGGGELFSYGGDIVEWPELPQHEMRALVSEANRQFQLVEQLPIPTIAAVCGACFGGGFELALHCDMIVAAHDARFRFPEATIAVPPLAGGVQRVAERAGRATATRLAFLSEALTGTEAQGLGLIARTTTADKVFAAAVALAEQLATGPTVAFQATKALLRAWSDGGVASADRQLLDAVDPALGSQDFRARALPNAVTAFLNGTPRTPLPMEGR